MHNAGIAVGANAVSTVKINVQLIVVANAALYDIIETREEGDFVVVSYNGSFSIE